MAFHWVIHECCIPRKTHQTTLRLFWKSLLNAGSHSSPPFNCSNSQITAVLSAERLRSIFGFYIRQIHATVSPQKDCLCAAQVKKPPLRWLYTGNREWEWSRLQPGVNALFMDAGPFDFCVGARLCTWMAHDGRIYCCLCLQTVTWLVRNGAGQSSVDTVYYAR